jgi:hypothetical protein
MSKRAPTIAVEQDGRKFYVVAEWSRRDRQVLAIHGTRDDALASAGKAAVQWTAGPVVERGASANA